MAIPGTRFRILVVRALQLGDLLCAVPALRALRHWRPDAHITLCGLPWSREFVARYSHLLDEHCEFPGYPGIPEVPCEDGRWNQRLDDMRGQFDLVVQLHGSGTYINEFVRALEAKQTAGFFPSDRPDLALDFGCVWPETGHEIQRLKQVVLALGARDCGDELELPLRDAEREESAELLRYHGLASGESYICLHAGGRSLTRRWPLDRYQVVASQLIDEGFNIVLTGTTEERDLSSQLQAALDHRCIDMVGRTTMGQMMGMIARARLLLTNDTGVSHIAAALRTPSVVLGLGSDLARWLPLDRQRHRPVYGEVPCRPCYGVGCPTQFECAQAVSPAMVLDAVTNQLNPSTAREGRRTYPLEVTPAIPDRQPSTSEAACTIDR